MESQCGVFRGGTRGWRHYSVGRLLRWIEHKALVQSLAAGKLGTVAQASNCSTLESRQEYQKSKVNTSYVASMRAVEHPIICLLLSISFLTCVPLEVPGLGRDSSEYPQGIWSAPRKLTICAPSNLRKPFFSHQASLVKKSEP